MILIDDDATTSDENAITDAAIDDTATRQMIHNE